MHGWLIHNVGLQTTKFNQIHKRYLNAARELGIDLKLKLNSNPVVHIATEGLSYIGSDERPDFVLFLDKDVHLARGFEGLGIPVFNSAEAIENADDKGRMHLLLAKARIKQIDTILAPKVFQYQKDMPDLFLWSVIERLGFPLVVKEAFGSFGTGVHLIHNEKELHEIANHLLRTPHLYQRYIKSSHGRDVRLHVVGDVVVAAVKRISLGDFRANVTNGGSMVPFEAPEHFKQLAIQATKALNLDFSGVDLLFDKDDSPIVCEVNSNAHIENIYQATGIDLSQLILKYIFIQLKNRK